MSNLEKRYIEPYQMGDVRFGGATLFSAEGAPYIMLLSPSGNSCFLSHDLVCKITERNVGELLKKKLIQKGFCGDSGCDRCLDEEIVPTFFMIDITTKCNMNCYYCLRHFEDSGEIIGEDRLRDILDYIIAFYRKHHLRSLEIQPWGGEPTIAADRIVFIRRYLDLHHVYANITVQSNALSLTESVAQKLLQSRVDVGFSIDGCEEIHNLHRRDIQGMPTYDRVVTGIRNWMRISGKEPGTISVVSQMSLSYLEQSITSLVRDVGIRSLKLNLMHPNSELFDLNSVVTVDDIPDIYHRIMDTVISLHAQGYHVTEYNISDRVSNLLTGSCSDICHSRGCSGGYRLISFAQDGSIYPCETIGVSEYRLGSIYDGIPLSQVIRNGVTHGNPYFLEKTDPKCMNCEFHAFCRGGCTVSARFHQKAPGQIDEKECAINRAVYTEIISRLLVDPSLAEVLTDGKIQLS